MYVYDVDLNETDEGTCEMLECFAYFNYMEDSEGDNYDNEDWYSNQDDDWF